MAAAEAKYDMTVYPVQVAVRSASDGASVHMVTLPHCDCPDFTNRRGRLTDDGSAITVCKHIREALARVGGWHRPGTEDGQVPLSRPNAYETLTAMGVSPGETRRALHEAEQTGRAYAGRPGSGSFPVRHEGSTKDGLFTIG